MKIIINKWKNVNDSLLERKWIQVMKRIRKIVIMTDNKRDRRMRNQKNMKIHKWLERRKKSSK
jgi:hypothetical protein